MPPEGRLPHSHSIPPFPNQVRFGCHSLKLVTFRDIISFSLKLEEIYSIF